MIDNLAKAGTELKLLTVLRLLDRSRFEPFLCILRGQDPVSRSLEPDFCPVLRLEAGALKNPTSLLAAFRLADFLRRQKIDILQLSFPNSTYLGSLIGRLMGVPLIVQTRFDLGYWQTSMSRFFMSICNQLIHRTLVNCEDGRRAALAEGARPEGSVVIIENGIDLSRWPRLANETLEQAETGTARIGLVANLRPIKDPELLVRAARLVVDRQPRASFLIAGEGELRPALERLIAELGLASNVSLVGSVTDIPAFLETLDIAVLCSRSEGMSNALLEYMAAGRAIVATAVGGNAELIQDGIHGLLVPARDPDRLAQAILRLLADAELRQRLGANASRLARESFSVEAMLRRFEGFYEGASIRATRREASWSGS